MLTLTPCKRALARRLVEGELARLARRRRRRERRVVTTLRELMR